jgi:hypothetical protein
MGPACRLAALTLLLPLARVRAAEPLRPVVEVEEEVYTYRPANNGAGPLWCSGSTCLVRIGDAVFASGLETLENHKPLNNCRWLLFRRGRDGWKRLLADEKGRTREPCPIAAFHDGRLFLSTNPTLAKPGAYGGPARPEILEFSTSSIEAPPATLLPGWDGSPRFTEHSYRSFAADGRNGELILFQNIGYTHAEWAFRDRAGRWSARGRLPWPWGKEYDKPQPIRVCYPNVALKDRAVHFCGVSDIVEPYAAWRATKQKLTGRKWDYDFRRLFYTWTPNITKGGFRTWLEVASRDRTCGWIMPGDLWVNRDGAAHILWTERAIDERLRAEFFPDAKQSHALNYAVVRDGEVALRRTLVEAREGETAPRPTAGRFHVTPDGRLLVFYYVSGSGAGGRSVSENRLVEVLPGGQMGQTVRVPLERPFGSYFTATPRAGSPPSTTLHLLGQQAGKSNTISYARIRLQP